MADIEKLVDQLSALTVLEAADLAKALEEKWGVSAAAAVAVAGPAAAAAPAAEEQTEFDVILTGDGGNKIAVIKEVRAITALGLTEAKALVESAPKAIKEGVNKAEAEDIKAKILAAGGTIELREFSLPLGICKWGGLAIGRPFCCGVFYCRVFELPRFYCRILVILNLFQDNVPPLVILKQVQDDEKELGTETPLA